MDNESLRLIFTDSDIESVKNTRRKDKNHPLKRILFPDNQTDIQVSGNTERAFKRIVEENKEWLLSLKKRLLDFGDYSEASSALAEIRAYHYLLEAGILVRPLPRKSSATPDFSIEENNEKVSLEVHAKQLNGIESKDLENFYNEKPQFQEGENICIEEYVIAPFGKPKEKKNILESFEELNKEQKQQENTTEIAIKKIASIKDEENQFSPTETSILWLDFQDEVWNLCMNVNQLLPVISWHGDFYSGAVWYAFYGWENAPIFENFSIESPFLTPINKMLSEGRFQRRTNIDAVVISFPSKTVVFENPNSQKPIKPWLWRKLINMPWFNFEYSYLNWPNPNLKQKLEIQKNTLIALSNLAE